jgi:nucleoside-diphosphate-sugar epimerase
MKVLITGGTGFIGSRLALKCLEKGDSVRVLGQENNPAEVENKQLIETKGTEVILGSITDRERIFEILQGVDVVYHLAAAQHEANVPDQVFRDVNVTGTKNILEASVNSGVKCFVHGSTIGVYGSTLEGNVDEQSSLKPDNIYGITKLEGEKLVLSFCEELPVIIIRISETYGPGDRRLLKLFKAIKKNLFFMIGSGENIHHLIYIDDLIQGLFLAATTKEAVGNVFVLAGKEPMTTTEMVRAIAQELGSSVPKFRAPLFPFLILAIMMEKVLGPLGIQPPLHRRRMDFFKKSFLFSQEKSLKTLGFVPQFSFRQGVSETARWYTQMGYL